MVNIVNCTNVWERNACPWLSLAGKAHMSVNSRFSYFYKRVFFSMTRGANRVIPDKYGAIKYKINLDTMVKRCAWGMCKSDTRYNEREYMKGVTFFPIPKPKTRCEECKIWVKACGRKYFTVDNVTKHSYICSKHFV